MTSLSEAYGRGSGPLEDRDPRRVLAGSGLFVLGALAVVSAILVLTTGLAGVVGAGSDTAAKRLAGTLAGLGIPAMFLSVVAVLPASRRDRWGVICGAALTVVGVRLFLYAYPVRWTGTSQSLAFQTAMVYFVGGSIALWSVFSAVASFKLRNNPQGTVQLEVTRRGRTRTVQVSRDQYRRYKRAIRGDGGESEAVVREIESLYED